MKRPAVIVTFAIVLFFVIAWVHPALPPFISKGDFTAELYDAAGIRSGDDVRISGMPVGKVTKVAAGKDRVLVDFKLTRTTELTADTRTEVKLASLLGERFLALTPGKAANVDSGATLPLANSFGNYTLERFWLEHGDTINELDLDALSSAVDTLTTELDLDPTTNRAALDGLVGLSRTITKREQQLRRLLTTTHSVTDEVVAQRETLVSLLKDGDQVLTMVRQRHNAIQALLRDTRAMVDTLSAMADRNARPMQQALAQMNTILNTLTSQKQELAKVLEAADPAMRLYVNSSGDGPWIGVNAPYAIFADTMWCTLGIAEGMDCQ